jgi:DNA-binding NarL/FixJ family response regulator
MSLLPQPSSIFDSAAQPIHDTIVSLLSLEPDLTVASAASAIDGFGELSIAGLIEMARNLPRPSAALKRRLVPVPGLPHDMREILSERELQVVRLVAEGISNKEISRRMKLSDKTVKNHISHILAKLHLTARTQVAVHALRAGLA